MAKIEKRRSSRRKKTKTNLIISLKVMSFLYAVRQNTGEISMSYLLHMPVVAYEAFRPIGLILKRSETETERRSASLHHD